MQVDVVGDRARNEDGHRNDGLGRGGAAVVAGFQRPVPQMLIDGEYGPAFVPEHAPAGDQHLPVGSGLDRRAGPAAGDRGVGTLRALAAFDDVPVVGGEDDDPARVPRPVQQRRQVLDGVGAPLGAARVRTVQGVVDGVQHARDQGMTGHVGDSRGNVISHGIPEPGRIQRFLVEQGRARQAVGARSARHTRVARRPGRPCATPRTTRRPG